MNHLISSEPVSSEPLESSTDANADTSVSPPTPASLLFGQPNSTDSTDHQLSATQRDDSLLDNLDSYIAVGILRKRIPASSDPSDPEPEHPDQPFPFPDSEVTTLEKHRWIKTSLHTYTDNHNPRWCYLRVYVLPDDVGRSSIPRSSTGLRRALKVVMARVDSSALAWDGHFDYETADAKSPSTGAEDDSLWYIFNTLRDPEPRLESVTDPFTKRAMESLLLSAHGHSVTEGLESEQEFPGVIGLKTPLYPYQRRSAATMLRREAQPAQMLDPRLQEFRGPMGQEYYYDKEEGGIVKEKRMYSEACGGILAETMGCGKTLISLAVILATRGHFPKIPLEYQETENPVREKTASLVDMAAAAAGRASIPWKAHFDALKYQGAEYSRCVKACDENRGSYTIPPPPARHSGRSGVAYPRPPPLQLRLCSGTLIIVPPNLLNHWQNEIAQHTEGLRVLVLRNSSDVTPSPDELVQYDIVLFSRVRFEKEAGEEVHNRRVAIKPEDSPLTKLHWLRVMVDEGHNVAGTGHRTTMMHVLDQLQFERRWVVSGTPSSGLYGVEVSLASHETHPSDTDLTEATSAVLRGRKKTGSAIDHELKDLDKLRLIVVEFLDLKPWSNSRADDPASWTKYIKPLGDDGKRRKAQSLRSTLQSLVVRHRMEVINSEIPLPRLHNKVMQLEPTFYDKLNLNLFIFIIAVNAITSERQDQDYMFHPRNRKHLSLVISNLRQAGFWWAGSEGDLSGTVDVALRYMDNHRDKMAAEDIALVSEGVRIAQKAMACESWQAFKQYHELGVFTTDFPSHARDTWALNPSRAGLEPLLLGISQAHHAQKFVTSHLNAPDPAENLAGAGIKARGQLSRREARDTDPTAAKKTTPDLPSKPKSSPKKTYAKGIFKALPPDSPLAATKLVATASAKLTYLLDRVLELHKDEKIIIFYDNNNSAFWIAEGLELLGIDFRIYANTLKPALRTEYLTLFRDSEHVRVLLMDLRQASHGLHIANASRVFIVNPIWQPNIESQAIKRAHRIGQTRPVFVETLVLKDTLEDKMLRRRKNMSEMEIQHAEKDLLDDSTMSSIIQNENFIPMPEDEDAAGLSYLRSPPGFFDRHRLPIPDSSDHAENGADALKHPPTPTPSKKRKHAKIQIQTSPEISGSAFQSPHKKQRGPSPKIPFDHNAILVAPPPDNHGARIRSPGPASPEVATAVPPNRDDDSQKHGDSSSCTAPPKPKKSVSIFGPIVEDIP